MENTEENQIIENKNNKITYLKNFLIIYGIWIVINIVMYFTCYHLRIKEHLPTAIGCVLLAPFAFVLVFLPAIFLLWLLFKKIKNQYWRCILISILIPLNNSIYYIIEDLFPNKYIISIFQYYAVSEIIGILSLCWMLPFAFITFLLTPKSIFKIKWYAVLTTFLMFIFGWIMAYYTLLLPLSKIKI